MNIAAATGDAERAFALMARVVALAEPDERLPALRDAASGLREHVSAGRLNAVVVSDRIFEVAELHGLAGEPGSEQGADISEIVRMAIAPPEGKMREPDPIEIDARPCTRCGLTIDQHDRDDTDEGPLFWCTGVPGADPGQFVDQNEADELERLAELRRQQEVADIFARLEADDSPCQDTPPPVTSAADYGLPPDGAQEFEPSPLAAPAPLALVTPPTWRDVPLQAMRWLATHRIPAGDATILSGDGGGGKTTVALQLAVSVERGLGDWLGTTCESGPVIFLSAEEPEHEMRRRLHRVARKRGLEPDEIEGLHFHFASPENCLLAVAHATGVMVPTPLFESLAIAAVEIRPVLIVVDSIAATFGGNQNDRVHARTFVSLFRRLAQDVDCAVLLLDHPSLSGITAGTGRGGSMDWQNATRARLHLETDGAGRVLEVKKSNYGPVGDKVTLQFEDGCFVIEGTASAPHQAAAFAIADQTYLACLDAISGQGRHVCHAPGRGFAPKTFAEMPQANGLTWRAFQTAQERLFAAGIIENVAYGPKSKGTKCIARKV